MHLIKCVLLWLGCCSHIFVLSLNGERNESWSVVGSTPFLSDNYLKVMIMEGLCNDGFRFIVNSKDQIFVTTVDLQEIQAKNYNAIPSQIRLEKGYDHLGDCQFSSTRHGIIYYAVEEPSYTMPAIFEYSLTDSSIDFMRFVAQPSQSHMPWIAQDPMDGLLYSSEYNNVSQLFIYDSHSLAYVRTLEIDRSLDEVQGGAFNSAHAGDRLLYLGTNGADTVYSVNVSSGHVEIAVIQFKEPELEDEYVKISRKNGGEEQTTSNSNTTIGQQYEFEGLTFLDLSSSGAGLMHNTGNMKRSGNEMVHCDLRV